MYISLYAVCINGPIGASADYTPGEGIAGLRRCPLLQLTQVYSEMLVKCVQACSRYIATINTDVIRSHHGRSTGNTCTVCLHVATFSAKIL